MATIGARAAAAVSGGLLHATRSCASRSRTRTAASGTGGRAASCSPSSSAGESARAFEHLRALAARAVARGRAVRMGHARRRGAGERALRGQRGRAGERGDARPPRHRARRRAASTWTCASARAPARCTRTSRPAGRPWTTASATTPPRARSPSASRAARAGTGRLAVLLLARARRGADPRGRAAAAACPAARTVGEDRYVGARDRLGAARARDRAALRRRARWRRVRLGRGGLGAETLPFGPGERIAMSVTYARLNAGRAMMSVVAADARRPPGPPLRPGGEERGLLRLALPLPRGQPPRRAAGTPRPAARTGSRSGCARASSCATSGCASIPWPAREVEDRGARAGGRLRRAALRARRPVRLLRGARPAACRRTAGCRCPSTTTARCYDLVFR